MVFSCSALFLKLFKGGSKNYDIVIPAYAGIPCLCGL